MFNHQINRGVLWKRDRGSIFIKEVKGFKAKKAFNYEIEAQHHGGDGRKKMEMVKWW